LRRSSGGMPGPWSAYAQAAATGGRRQLDVDGAVLRRILDGVADQVVDQGGDALHVQRQMAFGVGLELDLDAALQGQRHRGRQAVAHQGAQFQRRQRRLGRLGLGAFQRQQLVHHAGGAVDAVAQATGGFQRTRAGFGVAAAQQHVGVDLHRHQRRFQFVRGVGQELVLALDPFAEALHQAVDGVDQRRQLAVLGGRQRGQVGHRALLDGGGDLAQRAQADADDQPGRQQQQGQAEHGRRGQEADAGHRQHPQVVDFVAAFQRQAGGGIALARGHPAVLAQQAHLVGALQPSGRPGSES
jgi:hypothetical protein